MPRSSAIRRTSGVGGIGVNVGVGLPNGVAVGGAVGVIVGVGAVTPGGTTNTAVGSGGVVASGVGGALNCGSVLAVTPVTRPVAIHVLLSVCSHVVSAFRAVIVIGALASAVPTTG